MSEPAAQRLRDRVLQRGNAAAETAASPGLSMRRRWVTDTILCVTRDPGRLRLRLAAELRGLHGRWRKLRARLASERT
eukprot:1400525-Rhodomonas_salina.2